MGELSGISVRGRLSENHDLSRLTWLRVGGPADWLFVPADADDLSGFLKAIPGEMPVFPIGVGSNLIVRDGGLRGVVVRLGKAFSGIEIRDDLVTAGAAALDAHVARRAAQAGLDLTFLRTIPGAIGGAVRMNAGCYGTYVADRFLSAEVITRAGERRTVGPDDLAFGYRQTSLASDTIIVSATFRAPRGRPDDLEERMRAQIATRDATQPVKALTAGSTFRNPAGHSSTGRAGDTHELKAWKVIDDAGMRGARLGGAQMSEMHPNFLVNASGATAAELEALGEEVRQRVFQHSGIRLEWEIMRVGEPAPEAGMPSERR